MTLRKIAIIGSGYSAIGIAFHLRSLVGARISVFDECDVGTGGASAVSAGMLHPISPKGKMSWRGEESYGESLDILQFAAKHTKWSKSVFRQCSIARPLFENSKKDHFEKATNDFPEWVGTYDDNEIETHIKDMKNGYRFVVKLKKSIIVNSIAYMQSFWARMMEQCDVEIIRQKVENLSDISSQFDVVILATGADVIRLWGYQLPLTLIRGRNLIYNAEDVTWLSKYNALIVDKYAIHQPDIGEVVCGSTYEYSADPDTHPYDGDITGTVALLHIKLNQMIPALASATPIRCCTGIRVSTLDMNSRPNAPLILQHPDLRNVYAVTGMGSKGLLYHGLIGKFAVNAALTGDMRTIPKELRLQWK